MATETNTARNTLVVGVGTVGCRLAARIREHNDELRFLFIDTDKYTLSVYRPADVLLIGEQETNGRGTGKRPDIGSRAAEQAEEQIKKLLAEAEIVVVTASFGGGTGAGAAPVVAKLARDLGALSIVAAIDPFAFESSVKVQQAYEALQHAGDLSEAVVRIPCMLPPSAAAGEMSFKDAFANAEEYAARAASSLVRMVANPGTMQVDFGDLRRVISEHDGAVIGIGCAKGENRVESAIRQACNSSFLDVYRIHTATNVLLQVSGGEDLTLAEVDDGARSVGGIAADGDYLLSIDVRPDLEDEVIATVLLSGFSARKRESKEAAPDESATEAFIYEGVNVDTPTFLRRPRNRYTRPNRLPPDYPFTRWNA
ncbi:MAG TPA: hypothetical protein VM141_04640 [Planctomycetota bacterium]|nr:hypothetical protein [Planctomycetota bacterium]